MEREVINKKSNLNRYNEIEDNKLCLKHLKIMYEKGEVKEEIYRRMKKRYENKIKKLEKNC